MAPRDDQPEPDMPPIPDGGLSTAMPEWLRRPPAWRTLPDREEARAATVESTNLPQADTSAIDPRTFIQDNDLPEWLRSMRRSAPNPGVQPESIPEEGDTFTRPGSVTESESPGAARAPMVFRPAQPRVSRPSSPVTTSVQPTNRVIPPRTSAGQPRWEQRATTLALGVALVLALMVILVLVVW